MMIIGYGADTGALDIRLLEGQCGCRSLSLNGDVALNIGPGETLVGIEILDALQVFGEGRIPLVTLETVVPAPAVR